MTTPRSARPGPRGSRPARRAPARATIAERSGPSLRRRVRVIRVVVLVGVAGLIVQLVNLQVLRAPHFEKLSAQQLLTTVTIPALRGSIYDRNGQLLALSVPTKQVVADDFQIAHPQLEAQALASLLDAPAASLASKLEERGPGAGHVMLSADVSLATAATIGSDAFAGITLADSSVRTYPDGSLAESVLGNTYADGAGSAGLEYKYQQLLAGQGGLESIFESPTGVSLPSAPPVILHRPVPGKGLELTIDAPLQFVTEQALGTELVDAHGVSGTAIVMDTQTGQILAMSSLVNKSEPDASLTQEHVWPTPTGIAGVYESQNILGVTSTYEPGSVFKIVPFSEGLNDGVITPSSRFAVPDYVTLDGHNFHDAEQHGLEHLTATQILEYSSNIGTYEITSRLGEYRLLSGIQRLGFGQPSGLGFAGESSGILVDPHEFAPTDLASLPIGQVDAVTPLQVLDAYNVIANDGVFATPSLVRAYIDADGTVTKVPTPAQHRALEPRVAQELVRMLVRVVAGGTGTQAAVSGYTIAGKTGTAQIPVPGHAAYIPGAYNATFVGFAPAEHPVLSMIVVIQRPTPVIYGGSVSAPVFARVMGYALHRYGVPTSGRVDAPSLAGGSVSFLQDVT
jgi:cell division protein FtsI (penicillin-binding protein 3)